MKQIELYQIDAFTNKLFGGNPAAVCPLEEWLDEETMQKIAEENNLAETAYFVKEGDQYHIRWFMPHDEIDLCGHATLASAYVIFNFLEKEIEEIQFTSKSGPLKATKRSDGKITLDFPSRPPKPIPIPKEVLSAFNYKPIETLASRDLIILLESEEQVRTLEYDLTHLKGLHYLCFITTSKGESADFVSRVFDPNCTMPEDPVTGSAHASLIPYWQNKLHKNKFHAKQLSEREGDLFCSIENNRVFMSGDAVLYLKGKIYL